MSYSGSDSRQERLVAQISNLASVSRRRDIVQFKQPTRVTLDR